MLIRLTELVRCAGHLEAAEVLAIHPACVEMVREGHADDVIGHEGPCCRVYKEGQAEPLFVAGTSGDVLRALQGPEEDAIQRLELIKDIADVAVVPPTVKGVPASPSEPAASPDPLSFPDLPFPPPPEP